MTIDKTALIRALELRRMPEVDAWEKGYNASIDFAISIINAMPKQPVDLETGARSIFESRKSYISDMNDCRKAARDVASVWGLFVKLTNNPAQTGNKDDPDKR